MLTATSEGLHKLKSLADAVYQDATGVRVGPGDHMSAGAAAQCLSGPARLLAMQYGADAMRRACADLVAHVPAWESSLRALPHAHGGLETQVLGALAVLVRGVLPLAGVANTRAALAFWACETDAAQMARVAA
jgi:hypothetical protein